MVADLSRVEPLIASDYVGPRGPRGRDGFVGGLRFVCQAFTDGGSTLEALLVVGDAVPAPMDRIRELIHVWTIN